MLFRSLGEGACVVLADYDETALTSAHEELSKAYSEAGQAFYQQQSAQATPEGGAGQADGASAAPSGEAKAEEVAEADYEIVDDKK